MTTYPMHYTANANSWRRLAMLARLYWPILRPGLVIYSIVPALLYFLAACVGKYVLVEGVPIVVWPISMMFYLAPLMLTRRDCRSVSAQLPVTAAEKTGFLMLAFWIVVPGIIFLSEFIGNCIGVVVLDCSTYKMIEAYQQMQLAETRVLVSIDMIKSLWWANSIIFVATSVIVIYYVVKSRHNRVLAGILSYFVTTFVGGLLTVFVTTGYTIYCLSTNPAADADTFMSLIKVASFTCLASMVVAGIIYFVKLYKYLRNGGF